MKKKEVIKKNKDFNRIIESKKYKKNPYFVMYYEKTNELLPKFGISVGKKIGNAVVRNKLKRQVRSIIDHNKKCYSNYTNYIIMVRKKCLNISFQEMEQNLLKLLKGQKENKNE